MNISSTIYLKIEQKQYKTTPITNTEYGNNNYYNFLFQLYVVSWSDVQWTTDLRYYRTKGTV